MKELSASEIRQKVIEEIQKRCLYCKSGIPLMGNGKHKLPAGIHFVPRGCASYQLHTILGYIDSALVETIK